MFEEKLIPEISSAFFILSITVKAYPGIETTHIPITYTAPVYHSLVHHLLSSLTRFVFIDPGGLEPVVVGDLTKFDFGAGED